MANFIPTLHEIENTLKPHPTEGELFFLKELMMLNDEYTVYFQPFLNGKNPDIIIVRKYYGVAIVEVKDYDLNSYMHFCKTKKNTDYGDFKVRNPKDGHYYRIGNPFQQVENYKNMLLDIHLPLLGVEKEVNSNRYGIIKSCVFFYKSNKEKIKDVIYDVEPDDRLKVDRFRHVYLFGIDSHIPEDMENLLCYKNLNEELNDHIKFQLRPSVERREQDSIPVLTKLQEELSISTVGARKIRGVAGSGKSLVLAKRALNAFEKNNKVLILTYNITLKNYLGDNISRFQTYNKKNFMIVNIHEFMSLIYYDLREKFGKLEDPRQLIPYVKEHFDELETKEDFIYNTILIDEVQDFEHNWLEFIEKNILKKDKIMEKEITVEKDGKKVKEKVKTLYGEYVLFGDEKQNVYSIKLENKEIRTNIVGSWKELKTSYRLCSKIFDLALIFQQTFMKDDYNISTDVKKAQITLFQEGVIKYYSMKDDNVYSIYDIITSLQKELNVTSNDIAIINEKISILRDLESIFNKNNINCTTTFENSYQYNELKKQYEAKNKNVTNFDDSYILEDLENIRKLKKIAFYMNRGTIKLSTIKSFKGWEIDTLFLILDFSDKTEAVNELLYTAMTRCKNNLIIIDLQNNDYSKFFKDNIQ